MGHEFVDRMLEQSKAGELRSPVSETLDMHLVEFGRGETIYEMPAREDPGNPLGVIQGERTLGTKATRIIERYCLSRRLSHKPPASPLDRF